jgi:CPA2 family monovalent cation:H+ antiporter-2
MDSSDLLPNIAAALGVAFAGGFIARLCRLPPIVGYLFGGLLISPVTPGWDADVETLQEVADIGVIFLMFGIGLSFNIRDILAVKGVVIPGALTLMTLMTGLGTVAGLVLGLEWREALVIGFAISVASSAVISRTVQERGLTDSIAGRVAIGWVVVEDLATVVILALLPAMEPGGGDGVEILKDTGVAVGKAVIFVGLMLLLGWRGIPWVLRRVVMTGSRELFILAVVAFALGIATGGSAIFDVSVAIGAFVAGVVISETEMGHQATADVLPLREAFAVLFFVSVGILVEPRDLLDRIDLVLAVVAIIIVGKTVLALGLFTLFPFSGRIALLVAAALAQVGEFSFLIAQDSLELSLIDEEVYNVILAAAAITIALNPFVLYLIPRAEPALQRVGPAWRVLDRQGDVPSTTELTASLSDHVVILGYGRVGELTGHALTTLAVPFAIIEEDIDRARRLSRAGLNVVWGDAASDIVLKEAATDHAKLVVVALPDENSTVLAVRNIRIAAPEVPIVVRARFREEIPLLADLGVRDVVVPEYEGGLELMSLALVHLGYPAEEAEMYRMAVRDIHYEVDHA